MRKAVKTEILNEKIFHRLRVKMMLGIAAILTILFGLLFTGMNFYINFSYKKQGTDFLERLVQNNGYLEPRPRPESDWGTEPFSGFRDENGPRPVFHPPVGLMPPPDKPDGDRKPGDMPRPRQIFGIHFPLQHNDFDSADYFCLRVNTSGGIEEILSEFKSKYTVQTFMPLLNAVKQAAAKHKTSGIFEDIRWMCRSDGSGLFVACLSTQSVQKLQLRVLQITLVSYGICIIVACLIAWFLSAWAVIPVRKAFLEQKQFIADAGHELKTPIAVIAANVDVLLQDLPDNKWLKYIQDENIRLGQLVKDLLFLAHSDSGRLNMVMKPFDLAEMVNSVVLPFESMIFEQGKTLELNVQENMPVVGDEKSLKEVLIVLVDNALKNSDKGAHIRVNAYTSGGQHFIKVYNTGHGIARDELEKVFLRFYRSDASRARNTGGSGLGLAIAQSIVVANNGAIKADSEIGKWAEFTVRLPLSH